ncbi:MAG TPA: branched-chain amino acid ABC transporter permease [Acidimicrobiia bacterium]|nr:branched-chain amino acid ABC transporter permease [Acidimicrobiia bacterium]HIL05066.1 branched-chain amino acid ABC transporter permease [Acidimicrobiia bacterium]
MGDRLRLFRAGDHRRDGFLLGVAVGIFGVTFGVLASASGLSAFKATTMSLLVFTGASQFAAIGIVSSGGEPLSALGTALLLAARNGVYSLSIAQTLPTNGLKRLIAAQLVIDETAAMSKAQPVPEVSQEVFWVTGISVFIFWNAGTLVGVFAGQVVGDPLSWGLDAAFPAGFLALLLPHLSDRRKRLAALLGAVIAVISIPILPQGLPVLAAALGAVVAAGVGNKKGKRRHP